MKKLIKNLWNWLAPRKCAIHNIIPTPKFYESVITQKGDGSFHECSDDGFSCTWTYRGSIIDGVDNRVAWCSQCHERVERKLIDN